jgi:hypothetical protein
MSPRERLIDRLCKRAKEAAKRVETERIDDVEDYRSQLARLRKASSASSIFPCGHPDYHPEDPRYAGC